MWGQNVSKGNLLGYIDCPACGLVKGMRITEDKSGNPFGYCEGDCDQQLRIGGNPARVEKFYKHHPHIKRVDTVTDTGQKADILPVAGAENPDAPEVSTAPAPAVKKDKHWTEILGVPES